MRAENSAPKQRGKPFPKGFSGNPAGKPKGTRNRATMLAEQLLDGEAEAMARTAVEWAKKGDMTALRLCLDRILPPRRDRPVRFPMPVLSSAEDAAGAVGAITIAVARGELTPSEAGELSRVIEVFIRALETAEIERRLRAIEDRQFASPA